MVAQKWLPLELSLHGISKNIQMWPEFNPDGREGAQKWDWKSRLWVTIYLHMISRWCSDKESVCQWRRRKRPEFDPWVGKIPWRRKCQSTPVFLPGVFRRQRSLVGYSPQSGEESDMTERAHARAHTHTHTHTHTYLYIKFPLCKFWSRIFVPLLGSLSLQLQRNAFFFTPEKVQRVMHLCDAHSTLIKAQFRQQIIIPKYWEISHLQMRQKSEKDLT